MATILYLSREIIYAILAFKNISIKDCVNFFSTCNHFYTMAGDNGLWRRKFFQGWPRLRNVCKQKMQEENIDFKKLIEKRMQYKHYIRGYLTQMSDNYFADMIHPCTDRVHIDDKDLDFLIHRNEAHPLNYYLLIDELTSINEWSQHEHNLTDIYYKSKLLQHIKHYHLREKWQKLIMRPIKQHLIEEATLIIAQCYQLEQYISYFDMDRELNNIAQNMLRHLKLRYPMHPILCASREQFSFWRYNNIEQTEWENRDAKVILNIICETFSVASFYDYFIYADANTIRQFREFFLKSDMPNGLSIWVAIIFLSIARRLGICCQLMLNSYECRLVCMLTWLPKRNITNLEDRQYFYIDLNDNYLTIVENCITDTCFNKIDWIIIQKFIPQLIEQIQWGNNFIIWQKRRMLELWHLIEPDNLNVMRDLCIMYNEDHMHDYLNLMLSKIEKFAIENNSMMGRELLNSLNEQHRCSCIEKENNIIRCSIPNKRMPEMKFAVGMIVEISNSDEDYSNIGVITGWRMQERVLNKTRKYVTALCAVLFDDGCDYCFLEEMTKVNKSLLLPIRHRELGKYFTRFNGKYYILNETLQKHYPEDMSFLENLE